MLRSSPFWKNEALEKYLQEVFLNEEVAEDVGPSAAEVYFQRLQEWLCLPPIFTTVRVNLLCTSPEKARKKLQELLLQQYKDKGSPVPQVEQHPVLHDALVISPRREAQEPPTPVEKEVVVDLMCGVAVLRGADIYAPGVMGAPTGLKEGEIVSIYCDLEGRCLRGSTKPFEGQRVFVGNGVTHMSRRDLFAAVQPSGLAVQMLQPVFDCPSLGGIMVEELFIQNLPSIVCGHVVAPQAGEVVLDMCGAPGGKTTHLASLMNNQAVLLLKKGGTLVYSTCTITLAENEELVKWALDTYPTLTLHKAEPYVGRPGLKGSGLSDEQLVKVQRFILQATDDTSVEEPDCDRDTIGFFVACFKKA